MSRVPILGLGLLFVAGATLVGVGLLRGEAPWRSSPVPAPADPEWFDRSTPKADFLAHVRPLEGTLSSDGQDAISMLSGLADQTAHIAFLEIELSTTRVLRSGHEYDASAAATLRRLTEGAIELGLEVTDTTGKPVTYVAEVAAGEITRLGIRTVDDRGTPVEQAFGAPALDGGMPVAIGDLPIGDAVGLARSLFREPPELLGSVTRAGAKQLLVYSLPLDDTGTTSPDDPTGIGNSALIYLRAEDHELRTIRVFDASDRLVRIYGDFDFDRVGSLPLPRAFSVRSIPTNSHTRFRVVGLDLS